MTADLTLDRSLRGRFYTWLERGFSKAFFVAKYMHGDRQAAAKVGVPVGVSDYMGAAAAGAVMTATMAPYAIASHIPGISDAADRSLVQNLTKLLARYGHAEFTTNADAYRSAHT
jgi:hypothetical protein